MVLEIIDGAIQTDPHIVNRIAQTPSNGFDKWWKDWEDINGTIEIAKQYLTWVKGNELQAHNFFQLQFAFLIF